MIPVNALGQPLFKPLCASLHPFFPRLDVDEGIWENKEILSLYFIVLVAIVIVLIDLILFTSFRERSRGLTEAINKLEKFRNSLQMPKRPRTEGAGHERQITSSSGERSTSTTTAAGTNSNKATFCASPSHTEGSMAKADEKSKGVVPNKRMRTSMQDVRVCCSTSIFLECVCDCILIMKEYYQCRISKSH
jgi:hypothetical protein